MPPESIQCQSSTTDDPDSIAVQARMVPGPLHHPPRAARWPATPPNPSADQRIKEFLDGRQTKFSRGAMRPIQTSSERPEELLKTTAQVVNGVDTACLSQLTAAIQERAGVLTPIAPVEPHKVRGLRVASDLRSKE